MTTSLTIVPKRVEHRPMLLCVEWFSGTAASFTFDMNAGAGVGSPILDVAVKFADGTTVVETVDMRAVLTDWVNQIVTERESGVLAQQITDALPKET